MKPASITLHLRPLDDDLDVQSLKLLLKRLLRSYRLQCVKLDVADDLQDCPELNATDTPRASSPLESVEAHQAI